MRNLWTTFGYANQRNELDDGGGISPARRPRSAATGLHGATRVSELEHGQHFGRTAGCRSGRAVRRSCISRFGLRHHAVFPRVSGNDHSSGGNLPVGDGRYSRCDSRARIQTHPDCQRPRRQHARARVCRRMDRRSSGNADHVPQLVERAQSLGASSGNRSRRFPRIVDGKFSVDAPNEGRGTFPAEGDERPREITTPRPEVSAGTSQRRQLRRPLSA